MKELKVMVGISVDNKIVSIEPKNLIHEKAVDYCIMVARLMTKEEVDREASECMQQGCHTYERVNGRIHQSR